MRAYEGSETKDEVLERLLWHRDHDEIIAGFYTDSYEGKFMKGCAVGCLTHAKDGGHRQFPARWGIPVEVAYLIDSIHEGLAELDERVMKDWPIRIMEAIPEHADLSKVWPKFALWMIDESFSLADWGEGISEDEDEDTTREHDLIANTRARLREIYFAMVHEDELIWDWGTLVSLKVELLEVKKFRAVGFFLQALIDSIVYYDLDYVGVVTRWATQKGQPTGWAYRAADKLVELVEHATE